MLFAHLITACARARKLLPGFTKAEHIGKYLEKCLLTLEETLTAQCYFVTISDQDEQIGSFVHWYTKHADELGTL